MAKLDFQIEERSVDSTGKNTVVFQFFRTLSYLSQRFLLLLLLFSVFSQERNTDAELTDLGNTFTEYSKTVLTAF